MVFSDVVCSKRAAPVTHLDASFKYVTDSCLKSANPSWRARPYATWRWSVCVRNALICAYVTFRRSLPGAALLQHAVHSGVTNTVIPSQLPCDTYDSDRPPLVVVDYQPYLGPRDVGARPAHLHAYGSGLLEPCPQPLYMSDGDSKVSCHFGSRRPLLELLDLALSCLFYQFF